MKWIHVPSLKSPPAGAERLFTLDHTDEYVYEDDYAYYVLKQDVNTFLIYRSYLETVWYMLSTET